jgi:hypothetical protein
MSEDFVTQLTFDSRLLSDVYEEPVIFHMLHMIEQPVTELALYRELSRVRGMPVHVWLKLFLLRTSLHANVATVIYRNTDAKKVSVTYIVWLSHLKLYQYKKKLRKHRKKAVFNVYTYSPKYMQFSLLKISFCSVTISNFHHLRYLFMDFCSFFFM